MIYESNLYRGDIITIEGEKYCIKYDGANNPPRVARISIDLGDVVKITNPDLIYTTANKLLQNMTGNNDYYIRYAYGCKSIELGTECVVLARGEDFSGREVFLVRRKGILDGAVYIMGKTAYHLLSMGRRTSNGKFSN